MSSGAWYDEPTPEGGGSGGGKEVRVAHRSRPTHLKRERERAKAARRQAKLARREAAKARRAAAAPRTPGVDPDIADIRPGPQPPRDED